MSDAYEQSTGFDLILNGLRADTMRH